MWDLPRPGIELVSPALAGGFLTTEPPGKSHTSEFLYFTFNPSGIDFACGIREGFHFNFPV